MANVYGLQTDQSTYVVSILWLRTGLMGKDDPHLHSGAVDHQPLEVPVGGAT